MAKHSLVAVGGSGQSAAIAYLRLATISGFNPADLPNIYVVDADIKDRTGADAKPSLYSSLKDLFEKLTQGVAKSSKPQFELIYPYAHQHGDVQNDTTFADYILGQGGDKQETRYVIDSLFNKRTQSMKKYEISEQEVPLSKGFMARPNVGATTFFDKLQQDHHKLERGLQSLKHVVTGANSQDHVVVVIGSSFGGTGSGAAPSLAQQLATWATERHLEPKIGLFMTLPWFNPNGRSNPDAAPTHGSSDIQAKNTSGGLHYYQTSESFKSFDVFVANYAGQMHSRNDDSNSEQPEYEHVFNLLLAAQIQNYLINKITDTKFSQAGAYTFYLPQRELQFNASDSALLAFSVDEKLKQDVAAWAHEAQALRLALKYTAECMLNDFKPTKGDQRAALKKALDTGLAYKVAEQDGRPHMIIEEKKLFGLSSSTKINDEIYQNIAKKLQEREKQLADSIAWLNRLKENSRELSIDDASINARPESLFAQYGALTIYKNDSSEIASIRLFEEALKDNTNPNIIQHFETRTANGQDPYTAAAVQIEAELRRIIRIRGSRSRTGDENPASGAGQSGEVGKVFIPLDVGGQPVSRYLQKIELNQLVDDGKDWHGESVKVKDKNHPASLNGLAHASVPSPWGAALLTQWQQKLAIDSKDEQLKTQVARQLEAILWGIFSKRLVVKKIKARHNESMIDTVLQVRSAETGARFNEFDWLAVAINPQNQQVIAANYPTVGWFTAPTLHNVEWWEGGNEFVEDFLELPTESVRNAETIKPHRYEAKLIRAFSVWLQELLDLHGDHAGRAATSRWYPIVQYIHEQLDGKLSSETVALDLRHVDDNENFILRLAGGRCESISVKRVEKARHEILQAAQLDHLLVLEDFVGNDIVYQIPDSPLTTNNSGTAHLLDHSAVYKNADGQNCMKLTYQVNLPEGQFIESYQALVVALNVQQVIFPNFKADDWKLYFAGGWIIDARLRNQETPVYAYDLYEIQADGTKKKVQYIQNGEVLDFVKPLHFDRNYELYGRPDILVLKHYVKDQHGVMSYREAGVFNIKLEKGQSELKNSFKLALDFGTSHSCIVALDASDQLIRHVDFTRLRGSNDLLCRVLSTPRGDEFLFDYLRFLAPFAAKESDSKLDRNVLPSEFYRNPEQNKIENRPVENIDDGIRFLSILPMQFASEDTESLIKDVGAIGDYKWGANKGASSLTGTVYERMEDKLSHQYIKQMLRMALAFLRSQGYGSLATFRATYPEAFSSDHINVFAKTLEDIFKQLQLETGLTTHQAVTSTALLELNAIIQGEKTVRDTNVDQDSHGLVSEAMGALESAKKEEGYVLTDKQLQIVLDMGGGSTDVAVFLRKDKLNLAADVELPWQLTDSIRYAGHDVLQVLSTSNLVSELDREFQVDSSKDRRSQQRQRMGVLKLAMRNARKMSELKTGFVSGKFEQEQENTQYFFEGLFEYTRQLILSYQALLSQYQNEPLSIGVVLLGNGWRLGSLVYESTDQEPIKGLIKGMSSYLNKNLSNIAELDIVFPVSGEVSVKESIAYGSLLYDPRLTKRMGNKDNEKFSFVGTTQLSKRSEYQGFLPHISLKTRSSEPFVQAEQLPQFPQDANFEERLNLVNGWEGKGLHFTRSELNGHWEKQWAISRDKFILMSPMRDFLEVVWKEQVLFATEK